MTRRIDAERAEFEAWRIDEIRKDMPKADVTDGHIRHVFLRWSANQKRYLALDAQIGWEAWQAARRAPAAPAPQGWKLVPDDANMTDEQAEAICAVAKVCGGGAYDIYRAALAAAPKPPEAAPVQLPEPDSYCFQHEETGLTEYVDAQQVGWGFEKNNPRWKRVGAAYSEQKVRQLLANHDIQEQST